MLVVQATPWQMRCPDCAEVYHRDTGPGVYCGKTAKAAAQAEEVFRLRVQILL